MSDFCLQDAEFGPQSRCRSFDFTLVFENAILSMLPDTITLFISLFYLVTSSTWRTTDRVFLRVISCLLPLMSVVTLVAWSSSSPDVPATAKSYVTAALSLTILPSIIHALMLNLASLDSVTFFISFYLSVTVLLDTSRVRTFVTMGSGTTSEFFVAAFITLFSARVLTLIVLNIPAYTKSTAKATESSGFFSSIFLLWLCPLLWKGRKGNLEANDLSDFDQKSFDLYSRFELSWKSEKSKHPAKPQLFRALFQAFVPVFLSPIIPAVLMSLTQAVQPAMVNAAIRFIESYSSGLEPEPAEWGWALAGMFGFIFLTLTGASTLYWYSIARTSAYIRGSMSEAIYRKTLVLDVTCLTNVPGGNPMNLISSDIDRITTVIDPLHQMWSALITIALGLYLIYSELGNAFVATIIITIAIMLFTPYLSRDIRPLQTKLSGLADKRIRLISGILRQIRAIKLSAYETELIKKVSEVRKAELLARKKFWHKFYRVVCMTSVTMNALSLVTLSTYSIIAYLSHGESLTTAKLFTAYTAIGIITNPLYTIGQNYPRVSAAYACVKRIEKYLLSPETGSVQDASACSSDDDNSLLKGDDVITQAVVVDSSEKTGHITTSGCVEMDRAFVGWNEKVVLKELTTRIQSNKLTMIIGRVASGKTTFLQSLLEETKVFCGTISYPWPRGSIAYCAQIPWLQTSVSIRNNILFASPFDEEWYAQVLRVCALDTDLANMRDGDATVASGLSGGQRARIALARAVYARKSVVVLDDVFAALDGPTAISIFEGLFAPGKGVLLGRTVILATNKVAHLRYADWIIAMDNASIAKQGTYYDLQGLSAVIESEQESEPAKAASGSGKKTTAIKAEDLPSSSGSIARRAYMHYARAAGWRHMAVYALLLLLTVGIQTITPIYLQIWSTFNDQHASDVKSLSVYLPGYAGVEVAYTIALCYLFYYMIIVVSQRASYNLHEWQFSAVIQAPMQFFDSTQVGQVINRFSQDISYIDGGLPLALYDFLYQFVRAFGGMIIMIVSLPYMALVIFVVMIVFYLVQGFYLATSKRVRRLDLASKSPLYTLYQETMELNGLMTIRAASAEEHFLAQSEVLLASSQKPFYFTRLVAAWLSSTIGLMTAVVNTSVVILAVATRRSASAGLFAAAMSQAISLQDMLNLMLTCWTRLEMAAVSLERNLEHCNLEPEDDAEDANLQEPGEAWPTRGEIEAIDVIAKYRVTPILKGISFHVEAGKSLGICGRSGSGKSTVLLALLRALKLEGTIKIDGQDIMNISRKRLRKAITNVGQEPFVLDGTLRENLDITGARSDEEIWAAVESAQLKPAVSALEGTLDHQMQSISPSLSQGQIQLLAIARALLADKKIILLDEATANLDEETDSLVQEAIRSAFKDRTRITIAHRIQTIQDYDQVLVLKQGVVDECGDPMELMEKEGSVFRDLALASAA
ncbi:P-loop containing nucleoside triphosphate hydrolase protein [Dendrothele bispora CBS 962.96]|uniref:P-loop containing nucleoside triphosphate hydrolase protein n=1 Tax=Dendrothele bispora (strain CBS 962.96) TaxID=1314807 RepID=A0A4S8M8W8_DENBC|nr:P-loop containing nucleoside triphosphate hydrolase protein [Dendrothele bispora CBS 962.96]